MSDSSQLAAVARAAADPARLCERLRCGAPVDDVEVDALYPEWARRLSEQHWTPLDVCLRAAELLAVDERATVLDVGAGVGKFCLAGAARSGARFVGVEQRRRLVDVARDVCGRAGLHNVELIHDDVMRLDWTRFDGFYLYNPFYEHLASYLPRIDDEPALSPQLFAHQVVLACVKLLSARPGARVVSYHGFGGPMPLGFRRLSREPAGSDYLELWEKQREPIVWRAS